MHLSWTEASRGSADAAEKAVAKSMAAAYFDVFIGIPRFDKRPPEAFQTAFIAYSAMFFMQTSISALPASMASSSYSAGFTFKPACLASFRMTSVFFQCVFDLFAHDSGQVFVIRKGFEVFGLQFFLYGRVFFAFQAGQHGVVCHVGGCVAEGFDGLLFSMFCCLLSSGGAAKVVDTASSRTAVRVALVFMFFLFGRYSGLNLNQDKGDEAADSTEYGNGQEETPLVVI